MKCINWPAERERLNLMNNNCLTQAQIAKFYGVIQCTIGVQMRKLGIKTALPRGQVRKRIKPTKILKIPDHPIARTNQNRPAPTARAGILNINKYFSVRVH